MRRHLTAAAAALAAGLLLSSCGSTSAEPDPLPPSASSTTPSPSAMTPAPPALPQAASTRNKAGAIAYTQHFIDLLNHSVTTGDTAALREAYISHCTRCESVADGIDKTYGDGGYFRGGQWKATKLTYYVLESDVSVVDATVNYQAQTWVASDGASPTAFPSSSGNLKVFNLRWTKRGWRVSALDPNKW